MYSIYYSICIFYLVIILCAIFIFYLLFYISLHIVPCIIAYVTNKAYLILSYVNDAAVDTGFYQLRSAVLVECSTSLFL